MVYKKGKDVDLGAEPPCLRNIFENPPPPGRGTGVQDTYKR